MQDFTQTKHVDGWCWQALVRAEVGKAARAFFSKQTAHSSVSMDGKRKDKVVSATSIALGKDDGKVGQAALQI
jgi:hypothetical protein